MGLCIINIAYFFYIDKSIECIESVNGFGKIISIKEEKEYKNKYIVQILNDKKIKNINFKNINLIIYTEKNKNFLPGDIIKLKGIFSKPETQRNFGGFDYSKYLKQFKIFGIVEVEEIELISKKVTIFDILQILRNKLLDKTSELFKEESAGFLKSLLFGKTDEISENIKNNFRDSSISHVLAISGQHFNYVAMSLKFICDRIIKNKKLKNNILILFLIIFSNLTGNPVSGVRACIMGIMIYLASNFERKNNFYFSFIYSLIIIIVYNPYNIYNIGLWLSYMGTLGLVVFMDFFKKYNYHKIKKIKIKGEIPLKKRNYLYEKIIFSICKYVFENFWITVSAQILIFPITMYCFNTISFSFFISNILISIFVGPTLILGYTSIILSFFRIPFLNKIIVFEEFFIQIILKISEITAKLPLSKIYVVTPNFIFVLLFYIIVFFLIYAFHNKKIYVLKLLCSKKFIKKEIKNFKKNFIKIKNNRKIRNLKFLNKKETILIIVVFGLLMICIINHNIKGFKQNLEINFIDVGQGDCTYIKTPKGKNIIIDGGEGNTKQYDYGENVVLPYLLDKKVKKIDYLIISHTDSDHIGGIFALLKNIKVEKIIIGTQAEESVQYRELLKISKSKKIPIYYFSLNNKILIENGILLETLWPINTELINENALNNNSLVFKFSYNDFSILFTGDIEKIAEEQIVKKYEKTNKLKSQILKVAHHGSKTSTTSAFLEKVNPRIALIGVGKNNKFGHPSEEVLKRIEEINGHTFRTDENGEINILVNKSGKLKIKVMFQVDKFKNKVNKAN